MNCPIRFVCNAFVHSLFNHFPIIYHTWDFLTN